MCNKTSVRINMGYTRKLFTKIKNYINTTFPLLLKMEFSSHNIDACESFIVNFGIVYPTVQIVFCYPVGFTCCPERTYTPMMFSNVPSIVLVMSSSSSLSLSFCPRPLPSGSSPFLSPTKNR